MARIPLALVFALISTVAVEACSGADPSPAATCAPNPGLPTPHPTWIAYPAAGSTNVSTNLGEIVVTGLIGSYSQPNLIMKAQSGSTIALGVPTSPPSPRPTPFATAPPDDYYGPYFGITIPTLLPDTMYDLTDYFATWDDNPPQCSATVTQPVGSFTTGS